MFEAAVDAEMSKVLEMKARGILRVCAPKIVAIALCVAAE
jgi:hypothetical protein